MVHVREHGEPDFELEQVQAASILGLVKNLNFCLSEITPFEDIEKLLIVINTVLFFSDEPISSFVETPIDDFVSDNSNRQISVWVTYMFLTIFYYVALSAFFTLGSSLVEAINNLDEDAELEMDPMSKEEKENMTMQSFLQQNGDGDMQFELDHVGKNNPMTIEVIAQILSITDPQKYGIFKSNSEDPDPFIEA